MMRRQLLVVALAALLVTPMGAVMAQNETGNESDGDFDANESDANESDVNESDVNESDANESEANESDDEDEAEEDEDADANESDDEDSERAHEFPQSDWQVDNQTYTGDHIQVTVDEELPGLTDVNYLNPNASVFAEVALPGENFTYQAAEHVLAGETDRAEFAVRDEDGGHLTVEAEDNASVSIELTDGVSAEKNDTYSEENDSVYQLQLEGNETAWFYGEELSFDNGTFAVDEEAHLSRTFPAEEDHEEREEERRERAEEAREEREERMEDRREAGSQWERSNESFEGDNVLFKVAEDGSGIEDYAIRGSVIPVFAEASLATNETEWEAHGKAFELSADDSELKVVDVPPAVLIAKAGDNSSITLELADGVSAELIEDEADEDENESDDEDERVYELSLAQNRTAWIHGEEIAFDNRTFTVDDKAVFRAMPQGVDASENKGPGSMPDEAGERGEDERGPPEEAGERPEEARAHPLDDEARKSVERAVAKGQVAAEVHLGENDTEPVAVEMGDVQVRKAWAESDDGTRAGMTIEAPDGTPGTTVNMKLDASKLGNVSLEDAGERLEIRYDNETIAMADNLDDVLNPDNDNGSAEYLLLVGSDEVEILVSVPHFSPHTVEVYETQSSDAETNGAPGFTALSLVAATGLAAMVAGTRKQD